MAEGRVVEDEHGGVDQQCPGERDPLSLPAGEGQALLPHDRVVAVRQLADEAVGLRRPRRGHDLLARRLRPAEADVRGDGVGEQERVLEHHADRRAERREGEGADVVPVEGDHAVVGVVEPGQQRDDRRLAGTGAADERDGLPRRDLQADVAQHRTRRQIPERHVPQADRAAGVAPARRRPAGRGPPASSR